LRIGTRADGYSYFSGLVDELSIYNRALSSGEVAVIYASGSSGKCFTNDPAPVFVQQPLSQTAYVGNSLSLAGAAMGTPRPKYQWYTNGVPMSGATDPVLVLNNLGTNQTSAYTLVASNVFGTVTSCVAQVTVVYPMSSNSNGPGYAVLKSFTGSDGQWPCAGLVLGGSTLYGTTGSGGSSGDGVVFKVNMDGTGYTVLKSFLGGGDGAEPNAGLVLAGSTLYGTTGSGGSSGDGVVFQVNTDGTGYAVLKSFTGSDGRCPRAGLILAGSTLYGTTYLGGAWNEGAVFKVNRDGKGYEVLYSFHFSDGGYPWAGLVLAGSTLYGTTEDGGNWDSGAVFKEDTDGTGYALLMSFNFSDGSSPFAGLVLRGSTLYGTTEAGGSAGYGVVFKVNTDGSGYTMLKSFLGGSDGAEPNAGLVLAGSTLYGATAGGGNSGDGVVFQVNTDGTGYAVLKSFSGSDGSGPYGGLVLAGSTLYGTTEWGGSLDYGVVFSLAMAPPSITTPPLTQTAEIGTVAWFFVEVTNTPPESTYYQWYFDGTNALGGATNSYIDVTNVQPAQGGAYTVVVSNLVGAVTSDRALLSVIPPVERRIVPAIVLPGGSGSLLHIEYADSLVAAPQWFSLTNVTLSSTPQLCFDLSQPLPAQRFYRAWQPNGPQPALDMSMATEIPLTGAIGSSVQVDYINVYGPTNAWVTLDTVILTNTMQLYFDVTMFRRPTRLYRLVGSP